MTEVARRALLKSGLLAGLALAISPLAGRGAAAQGPAARLVGMFRHPESARAVGRAYLRLAPDEADAGRLMALIHPDAAALADDELRRAVAARQRADFAGRRTVLVDGWVLSRTEARLCALAVLTPA